MTHKMILMSHDFKEVLKVVVARRKHATVAQVEEQPIRTRQVGVSTTSGSSSSESE